MIIPSEMRETRKDKYHMILLLAINQRWIQMNLLPGDTGLQTQKRNFWSPRYKDVGHGEMSGFRLRYAHYY